MSDPILPFVILDPFSHPGVDPGGGQKCMPPNCHSSRKGYIGWGSGQVLQVSWIYLAGRSGLQIQKRAQFYHLVDRSSTIKVMLKLHILKHKHWICPYAPQTCTSYILAQLHTMARIGLGCHTPTILILPEFEILVELVWKESPSCLSHYTAIWTALGFSLSLKFCSLNAGSQLVNRNNSSKKWPIHRSKELLLSLLLA